MRPGPSGPPTVSDIEEADVLRVLLDEVAARLDLVAHQRRENEVRGRSVLDLDPHEHSGRRIHSGLREIFGVHLAEALEARDLDALLRELERIVAQSGERLRGTRLLAERNRDRKSTRLNSSHVRISYAVFCLKKK